MTGSEIATPKYAKTSGKVNKHNIESSLGNLN